jgi:EmrB/QacA subfamily drug resistance transporter
MTHAEPAPMATRPGPPASAIEEARETPATVRTRRLIFGVVCAGFIMSSLDMMIVNVAFPVIEHEFRGSTAAGLSWTLNAYSIVFAALLVPAGRLSDRASRKNGFLLGLALFTFASVLCAVSQDVAMLVAARVLQAAGAAALVPTSLGLLLAAYPEERRGGAVRAWTAAGAVAAALAPIIGGALAYLDWRWIFLINLPVGVVSFVVGRRVLPETPKGSQGPLPDLFGSLLLIVGVSLIALGLVKAPDWGWNSAQVIGCLVGGLVVSAAFFGRSARHPSPVVSFSLLRIRSFSMANLAALVFSACFSVMLFSLMLWSQNVWGYSALQIGLAMAPGTFLMPVVALRSGALVKRLGAPVVAALGCGLLTAGTAWWAITAQVTPDYPVMLLPGLLLTAVGSILATTTLVTIVTRDLPAASFATGSAINLMVRQVGFVIGISVFIAILGAPRGAEEVKAAFQHGWIVAAALGVCSMVIALMLHRKRATGHTASA